ncbi:hypothetical protein EX30DRAFT_134703 [Ascodesmis nigricans]|uniref:Uncharacterized protein n=1 Tax=Ascodesmis nigricans TaxID=341454 RepID=A0A4S2MN46_9PEZI|nr:hypothetical protein EX30DRAFT_134703 [Ascodesmis nigricans]
MFLGFWFLFLAVVGFLSGSLVSLGFEVWDTSSLLRFLFFFVFFLCISLFLGAG